MDLSLELSKDKLDAEKILNKIVLLLENETITDFYVIDEIVELLIQNGIDVEWRHDF